MDDDWGYPHLWETPIHDHRIDLVDHPIDHLSNYPIYLIINWTTYHIHHISTNDAYVSSINWIHAIPRIPQLDVPGGQVAQWPPPKEKHVEKAWMGEQLDA